MLITWPGMLETMDANIISEIPFPMPCIFISSPSHIISVVPAVSVMTISIMCIASNFGIALKLRK